MACFMLASVFLSGCAEGGVNETSIKILKKGRIESDIIEPFGMDYYSEKELGEMLSEAVEAYNLKKGEKDGVTLKDVEVEKEVARARIIYKSAEDYAEFNNVDFFCGKVKDAREGGYDLRMTMLSLDNGEKTGLSELVGVEDNNIVIISEPVLVETDSDIEYVSANVEYIDARHARMSSDSGGLACIVLEK